MASYFQRPTWKWPGSCCAIVVLECDDVEEWEETFGPGTFSSILLTAVVVVGVWGWMGPSRRDNQHRQKGHTSRPHGKFLLCAVWKYTMYHLKRMLLKDVDVCFSSEWSNVRSSSITVPSELFAKGFALLLVIIITCKTQFVPAARGIFFSILAWI